MAVRIENQAEPIPGYRLIERIGGGGFGEVWKCEAPGGLHKAIKFVFGDLKSAGDNGHRAEQELKALSRVKTVRHPYVLSLERYDIIDGQLIIVMELADRNLWDRFKECRAQGLRGIPRDELLGFMEETAEALDLMNGEYGLQHLDIKPQNLFLVHQHVKVADFGLVKDLEGMQASVTGGVTPVYAAPETFDGWVSRYCDQYSLAIVYQELLTGQRPFSGTNVRQLILQHLQAPPNLTPLPPAEQPVIARALAKTPNDRYPTVGELIRALRAASDAPAAAVAPSKPNGRGPSSGPPPAPPTAIRLSEGDLGDDDPAQTAILRARPDSGHRGTEAVRPVDPSALQAAPADRPLTAPPAVHSDGILFPALVVGLGSLGLSVLQRLRENLFEQFGSLGVLPNLRLLLMDTDPEVMRAAARGSLAGAMTANDVLLAPLNRPSYYLKPREGRDELNNWFNPRMLYRIPRSQVTTGVRALGRLAFCDNYRAIVRRLETELTACLDPNALAAAARQTGLGVRTNRPRVYVVTSLAGGTGSGTFIDLAYLTRSLLKRMGYEEPDVVGLLLLPSLDGSRTRTMTVGNAYAALTELSHYATPGTVFSARYHEREPALEDPEPPFNRCMMLPLPEEADEVATRELADLAGHFLARDLCSPLGRAADLGRAGASAPPWQSRGLYYQTFGLHRLSWPRRALVRKAARRLCQRLVQRWMSKDGKPMREAVQNFVQQQWSERELGADHFIDRLQGECVKVLGGPPETAFARIVEPIVTRCKASAVGGSGLVRRKASPVADVAPEELADVLTQFEALLGKPGDEATSDASGSLVQSLLKVAQAVGTSWEQRLVELPVQLIEEPEFRLAGAEEAVRLLVASIEQILQTHEALGRDLAARCTEAYDRLRSLVHFPLGTSPTIAAADLAELLRNYPKWRFQCLILQQVSAAFLGLRGNLSDELREINFCRVRLGELLRILEEGERAEEGPDRSALGARVFPAGCKNLDDALDRFLATVTPESELELDFAIQTMLKKDFLALVHVCLTTANVLKNVEPAILQTAEAFVEDQLVETNAAETFLELHADEDAAAEIAGFYDEAAPELSPNRISQPVEMAVLVVPPGEAGDHYRELASHALTGAELVPASGGEDVLIYREVSNLLLNDLDLLGPQGQDAYRQMSATENFTPHARIDVDFGGRH